MWKSRNSRCIFLPVPVVDFRQTFSREYCLYAPLKSNGTLKKCSPSDSQSLQYGTTCEPSPSKTTNVENASKICEGFAMNWSFVADFHAKIYLVRERCKDLTAKDRDCGENTLELLAKFDRASCSWKIVQCLFDWDLEKCSAIWPKWGMMVRGDLWKLHTSALGIIEDVFGGCSSGEIDSDGLSKNMMPTPMARDCHGASPGMKPRDSLDSFVMLKKRKRDRKSEKFATPSVCGNYNRKGASAKSGDGLATQVAARCKYYPTVTTGELKYRLSDREHQSGNCLGAMARRGELDKNKGQLNPDWVEWLMGWLVGWTDLACENDALRFFPISEDPAESGELTATTTRRDQRRPRIKEIGNGQVPQCAAATNAALAGILEGFYEAHKELYK